jgi:hypothetical protein
MYFSSTPIFPVTSILIIHSSVFGKIINQIFGDKNISVHNNKNIGQIIKILFKNLDLITL